LLRNRIGQGAVPGSLSFVAEQDRARSRAWKPVVLTALLLAAIALVHLSETGRYLHQNKLLAMVAGCGALAIGLLIYALAPAAYRRVKARREQRTASEEKK
jgi:hypothetical protein